MERMLEAEQEGEAASSSARLPPLPNGKVLQLHQASLVAEGTGALAWPAASVTARWLRKNADGMTGAAVLDLGCGTGAVGLFAAALGASRVLLTDQSDGALANAKRNIAMNRDVLGAANVATRQLAFGAAGAPPMGPWTWILGSDIVYDGSALTALMRTLCSLLAQEPPPRIILAIPNRTPTPVLSYFTNAKGLRASVLTVERAPEHDGGSAQPGEQERVPVSVVEVKRDH